MTVCIAARSEGSIIGVSDRMLTSGDIQFEPSATPKLTAISMTELVVTIADGITKNPTEWWPVKDVVDIYVKFRNAAKRKRAAAALLAPLGLTIENYRDEMRKFNDSNAEQLMRDLIQFEVIAHPADFGMGGF